MSNVPVWLWWLAGGMSAWAAISMSMLYLWHGTLRLRNRYEPKVRRSTYGRERA